MHKETIIYGIGKCGKEYVEKCVKCGVKGIKIVDSNSTCWGDEFLGIFVQNPQEVFSGSVELVVVAVSDKYRGEIFEQLTNIYKIPAQKIVHYTETLVMSDEEVYNLGDMSLRQELAEGTILTGKDLFEILRKDSVNDLEQFFFEGKHKILDKWLHYFEAYERFFSKYRGKDVTILEIGVFKGGSLQMWKHYFNAADHKVKV